MGFLASTCEGPHGHDVACPSQDGSYSSKKGKIKDDEYYVRKYERLSGTTMKVCFYSFQLLAETCDP
jgi:hypothetical protein